MLSISLITSFNNRFFQFFYRHDETPDGLFLKKYRYNLQTLNSSCIVHFSIQIVSEIFYSITRNKEGI